MCEGRSEVKTGRAKRHKIIFAFSIYTLEVEHGTNNEKRCTVSWFGLLRG